MSEEKNPAAKSGIKTTEFWISMAAMVVGALMAAGTFGDNPWVQLVGAVASALNAAAYAQGRSLVKKAEAKTE